ncbi:MAG: NDP-sugar synthase [Chloroflexota bacterium]
MEAVILVGGKGTRLLPLTCNTPKPMVPVLNKPFMDYVIQHLAEHGVRDVIMAMGHLPQSIKNHFGDGTNFNCHIAYALENTPMDTAGAVKNAERYLSKKAFLVLNGDIFTDLDFTDMVRFHREKKAKVTIALTPVEDPTAYGLIETDSRGRITRFLEKPRPDQITTNMINAGTYVLEPEVLDDIPRDTRFSFERKLFPMLLERGEPVYAYASDAYWMDIGTPERYLQIHRDLLAGKSKLHTVAAGSSLNIGEGCRIHKTAKITGSVVIGRNSAVGANVTIKGPAVIGEECVVGEDSTIEESVIWQKSRIGAGAMLKKSFVADNCTIAQGSTIEETIMGDHVSVGCDLALGAGSKIWPGTVAEAPK